MGAEKPSPSPLRRNALANLVGRFGSALLWLGVTPYALGRLGPERFGVWSLFFVIGGYAAALDLGMSSAVARFVALAAARRDRAAAVSAIARSLAIAVVLGGLWASACVFLRGPFCRAFHIPAPLQPEVERSLIVFALSLLLGSFVQVIQGALMGLQRMELSNLLFLAGLALNMTTLVVGLSAGMGLMAAALGAVLGAALSLAAGAPLVRSRLKGIPEGHTTLRPTWRDLSHFGGYVQATNALAIGQLQAGKVVLGLMGRLAAVAQYELGFRVAYGLWSLTSLIQIAAIPAAAHASAQETRDELRGVYLWASRWTLALGGWTLAGLWLTAPALFVAWLGPGHDEAVLVARGLAIAFALATVTCPGTSVARGAGWPGLEAGMFGAALLLSIPACVVMASRWGSSGAALALIPSYVLAGAGLLLILHRRLGVSSPAWLGRLASPRLVIPFGLAVAIAPLSDRWLPGSRAEAIGSLALVGGVFTLACGIASWRLGDARSLWATARHWMVRLRPARASGGAP